MALYSDLLTYFREHIRNGTFAPGARLPTELELTQQYKLSRGTIRQALNILVSEGYLERVRGRGTFVRPIEADNEPTADQIGKRIGLVLPNLSDQLTLGILAGVEQAAKARGYQVSFAHSEERLEQQQLDIARLRADQSAGLIIFPVTDAPHDETILRLHAEGVPFVLIDRYYPEIDSEYVVVDNLGGGYRATEHLLILGHTQIAFVYSTSANIAKTTSVRDRWRGYRQALESYGLQYDESLVICLPYQEPTASHAHDAFVLRPDRPSAVFAVHDIEALQIVKAAKRCGVRIPEDLALVGFDDLSFAAHISPPLTTLAQPRIDVGTRAANLLINRIEGQKGPPFQLELPTNLIVRESCGARLRVQRAAAAVAPVATSEG